MTQVQTDPSLKNFLSGFNALSDPLRLRVVEILRSQELCVCELREQLDVSPSKLSFHLRVLREANLVRSHHEGRWIYYSLNLTQFVTLEQYLAVYGDCNSIVAAENCEN